MTPYRWIRLGLTIQAKKPRRTVQLSTGPNKEEFNYTAIVLRNADACQGPDHHFFGCKISAGKLRKCPENKAKIVPFQEVQGRIIRMNIIGSSAR
jgi:hypothetical protein